MQIEKYLAFLPSFLLLSGCATFEIAGEIQSGRMALMKGDPQEALAHSSARHSPTPTISPVTPSSRQCGPTWDALTIPWENYPMRVKKLSCAERWDLRLHCP